MKQDKKLVNFRISESLADELREVAEHKDIPQSQIVRDAVKEKVRELKAEIAAETELVEAAA